ncbi:MAG: 6-carboxytetrahydropterin synthase QueD [Candidatus Pacearchaeota archaeon]
MIIGKEFRFEAAHSLEWHNGKCKNVHGHSYKFHVLVKGEVDKAGMVIDFYELNEIINDEVLSFLDHSNLNDIIENPTAENISIWIWDKLKNKINGLYEIKLWETGDSFVVYNG